MTEMALPDVDWSSYVLGQRLEDQAREVGRALGWQHGLAYIVVAEIWERCFSNCADPDIMAAAQTIMDALEEDANAET